MKQKIKELEIKKIEKVPELIEGMKESLKKEAESFLGIKCGDIKFVGLKFYFIDEKNALMLTDNLKSRGFEEVDWEE